MFDKIATILLKTGNAVCIKKGKMLNAENFQTSNLYLRSLELKQLDVLVIAEILDEEKKNKSDFLKLITFSYNNLIGDKGAIAIAKSLPNSILEIGLVDCEIGDKGGVEILNWMKTATNLQMICIEQNNFSDTLKKEFNIFKKDNPKIMVVI